MHQEPGTEQSDLDALTESVRRLDARLARIEAYLRIEEPVDGSDRRASGGARKTDEELEFKVGQEWFGRVGIAALGVGIAFTVCLPYRDLPPAVPSLLGYALAAGLYFLAAYCRSHWQMVASQLGAIAMALTAVASFRLCFFGAHHALSADSVPGMVVLALTGGLNLALALRRGSLGLVALALIIGYASSLAAGSAGFAVGAIGVFSILAAAAGKLLRSPVPILVALPCAFASYLVCALNNPFLRGDLHFVGDVSWAPAILALSVIAFAWGLQSGGGREPMTAGPNVGLVCNALCGYSLFLLHTLASYEASFVYDQLAASGVLITLAVIQARRTPGVVSFVYAMSGFLALSFAILKAVGSPDVFVWLSVQSVVVVATAIWLRSRFMIVANFLIYGATLAIYVTVAHQEKGVSIGFGLAALVTARLLGWKKERLELKTELMRNAYLAAAFCVFPYALAHLVPGAWVGLAWVGAALFYYLIGTALSNRKYRWMGHATLLLTACYLTIVGIKRLDPLVRNVSFLVLGAVLVAVSLIFTRLRAKAQKSAAS